MRIGVIDKALLVLDTSLKLNIQRKKIKIYMPMVDHYAMVETYQIGIYDSA